MFIWAEGCPPNDASSSHGCLPCDTKGYANRPIHRAQRSIVRVLERLIRSPTAEQGPRPSDLSNGITETLVDAPRSGFPGIFTPEQILEIIAIACERPDPTHRIRFVYTPKRASWLNQIELWFSILVRRPLKRASFTGVEQLNKHVLAFIDYFNKTMAKPFKGLHRTPLVV